MLLKIMGRVRCFIFTLFIIVVFSNDIIEPSCPYDQFEAFQSPHTPLADECETKVLIDEGPCEGAIVHIKALGIYTTVVDIQLSSQSMHCFGEDLVNAALLNRTVRVPMKYFGYMESGCFDFPATIDLTPHEATSRFIRGDIDTPCGEGQGNTMVHVNTDFDNVNTWHSLAHLHSLWSASSMLQTAGRPLKGNIDMTSGRCKCSDPDDKITRKSAVRAIGEVRKATTNSISAVETAFSDIAMCAQFVKDVSAGKKNYAGRIFERSSKGSSWTLHKVSTEALFKATLEVKVAEETRYNQVSTVPEWGIIMNRDMAGMAGFMSHCVAKSTQLEELMEGESLDWHQAEAIAQQAIDAISDVYNLSVSISTNASYNSKVLLEALSHAASLVRRSTVAVGAVVSAMKQVDNCLHEEARLVECVAVAESVYLQTHDALTLALRDLPVRDRYSRGHLCRCSLATTVADALMLPHSKPGPLSKINPVPSFNFTNCYHRHLFITRHRKTDPSGGWPGYTGNREQEVSSPQGDHMSCGSSEGAYWNAITGLLWDAKLCASSFKCDTPPQWDLFMRDVMSAMQLPPSAASDITTSKTLCYMSRGAGVRGDGMEDEDAMRHFITSGQHTCKGRVLDFTEGSMFFKNFSLQASTVTQCDVLIGPHGAGLAHLIWMSAKVRGPERGRATLLELVGGSTQPWYYHHLSEIAGVDYVRIGTGGSDFETKEGIGLTPNPDITSLGKMLDPLCSF